MLRIPRRLLALMVAGVAAACGGSGGGEAARADTGDEPTARDLLGRWAH